MLISGFRR